MPETRQVIVIGSGPAGLTAALYTARANLNPLVIEGNQPGGQLTLTTAVENFPGFPEGIMGPELMEAMKKQAARFGADFVTANADQIDLHRRPFQVGVEGGDTYRAKSVIIATGASPRMLGLPEESQLMGRGLSTCATCDGFFFADRELVVVGGGDTAMEEALFLTKFASKVTVVHRRDELRASKVMQERAFNNAKIEFEWNAEVVKMHGDEDGSVTGVTLRSTVDGTEKHFPCDGIFLAIGHIPNTDIFRGLIDMDDQGYIVVTEGTRTNIPGVFTAGDAHDQRYRQAITAAGMGCMAAIDCERWLGGEG